MQSLRKSEISKYLQDSEYFETIQSDDIFELEEKYYKKEIIIITFEDLIIFIRILDFWLVNKIPDEFYDWVFKNKDKVDIDVLVLHFTKNHLIDEIKIIITSTDENVCENAAKEGCLNLLKYAHKNGCKWSPSISHIAANNGHLDCIIYAYENDYSKHLPDEDVMWHWGYYPTPAANGHLDCLKYLHENNCHLPDDICNQAAGGGHVDCLKYAHEKGYEWNKWTCHYAATNGHLDCLKYLISNECPFDENIFIKLASENDFNGLKFVNKRFPDKLKISKYILMNNYKWDESLSALIISNNDLEALKVYKEYGCPT